MKFGDRLSNAPMPVGEQYLQSTPNTVMGDNENIYNVGYFTMPFYGHLYVDMWAAVEWPGTSTIAGVATWLSVHTYSPVNVDTGFGTTDNGVDMDCAGIFSYQGDLATHAYWTNLTANQQLQVNGRLYTTAPGTAKAYSLCAVCRPMPA